MCENPKVAFLGAGRVGKTSILHRSMFGTFQETYMETVEDIHLYHVNETGKRLFVNFSSRHQMFLPGGHFLHPDYFLR
jgi:GTPase SAR1 family protein